MLDCLFEFFFQSVFQDCCYWWSIPKFGCSIHHLKYYVHFILGATRESLIPINHSYRIITLRTHNKHKESIHLEWHEAFESSQWKAFGKAKARPMINHIWALKVFRSWFWLPFFWFFILARHFSYMGFKCLYKGLFQISIVCLFVLINILIWKVLRKRGEQWNCHRE